MRTNIVIAVFGGSRSARTCPLYQWDYGQVLRFAGINLPETYKVHFSNAPTTGNAKTQIGDATGVTIPDEYLTTGLPVYAWVYLNTGENDGETVYMVHIPVIQRPQPTEDAPTPVQQGLIEQAIATLNDAVEQTAQSASDAQASANDAASSAERAEQAANNAGYIDVEIDENGHLIYRKTDAVDVDFSLANGHLIMEVV